MEDIREIANNCLNCGVKPCSMKGCPIHTNIPGFISEIKNDNIENAYNILQSNNIFSHICSIVCPQEKQCEGSCVRGIKGNPVSIGKLERYVNENAKNKEYEKKFYDEIKKNVSKKTNKKVAIIGGGPAGLECAYELIINGIDVTIFEKKNYAGGILMNGIPDFRLSKELIKKKVEFIKDLGVKFEFNKEFGVDFDLKSLQEKYDFIFVAIGLTNQISYDLGKGNIRTLKSDEFLEDFFNGKTIENLGRVAIIGGGNVAMDVSRVALRMGAKESKILYRRNREYMPACEKELDEALAEGVIFKENVRVISIDGSCLNCIRTKIVEGKAVDDEDTEVYKEEADTVIFAIGSKCNSDFFEKQGIKINENGFPEVNDNYMSSISNIYIGGDLVSKSATVCNAIATGRKASYSIIEKIEKG